MQANMGEDLRGQERGFPATNPACDDLLGGIEGEGSEEFWTDG